MTASFETVHAVILKERFFSEYDAVYVVMTKEHGKQSIVARGIKKQNSRLRSSMQLFNQSILTTTVGKNMPVLTGAEVSSTYSDIRTSYIYTMVALYFLDVFDRLVEEGEKDEPLYELLTSSLEELTRLNPRWALFRFEWQLLNQLGYEANFDICMSCGEKLKNNNKCGYAAIDGSFHCQKCHPFFVNEDSIFFSSEEIIFLQALEKMDAERLNHIYLSENAEKNVERYLNGRYRTLLFAPLKSRTILNTLLKS